MMSKKTTTAFGSLLILCMLVTGAATAAPAAKVDVCHIEGNGDYHKISISENALQQHLDHGDNRLGDPFPGMPGYVFGDDCLPESTSVDVAGDWAGHNGLAGFLGFTFEMTLSQDALGNVTGTINYDVGNNRTVTGSVQGHHFTFTTHDNPFDPNQAYWANCTPCVIDASGTYFQGSGTDSSAENVEFAAYKVS